LGARDTLRLESGLLLYGRDANESTTPYEARLGWLVDLDRPDFMGREALIEASVREPERLLVGLKTSAHAIPRTGDDLLVDGRPVGKVTSGSPSPVLGHPVALGYVPPKNADPGTELEISMRGRRVRGQVVQLPFYRRGVTSVPAEACTA
jgi:aminomethyltransferase